MKIIARNDKSLTFIVEMPFAEMAHLMGYPEEYNAVFWETIRNEENIPIDKMFERLYNLSKMQERLKETQTTLRNLADQIDPLFTVVKDATENQKS